MIFERQDYQQECIANIILALENFDFAKQNAENLENCLDKFYSTHAMPLKNLSHRLNLDILMETGTGKTFTYLNLIFELHKTYKQNKFIIFVPRKAILESSNKTSNSPKIISIPNTTNTLKYIVIATQRVSLLSSIITSKIPMNFLS